MDEEDCRIDKEDCTMNDEECHAIDTIIGCILERFHVEWPRSTLQERLPTEIGGESGTNYIHRFPIGIVQIYVVKFLRLKKEVFIHFVSMFMESGLLKESRFVKPAEIVAMT